MDDEGDTHYIIIVCILVREVEAPWQKPSQYRWDPLLAELNGVLDVKILGDIRVVGDDTTHMLRFVLGDDLLGEKVSSPMRRGSKKIGPTTPWVWKMMCRHWKLLQRELSSTNVNDIHQFGCSMIHLYNLTQVSLSF